uniref:Uncharacterized protein n=1 Tax=Pipistrellus kuhlii TaxID=59472 RepID=A0A7J7QU98_PIPKU|nr:hypothetical protein mPipKuh1_008461 [Pipistrellus kuhlii]
MRGNHGSAASCRCLQPGPVPLTSWFLGRRSSRGATPPGCRIPRRLGFFPQKRDAAGMTTSGRRPDAGPGAEPRWPAETGSCPSVRVPQEQILRRGSGGWPFLWGAIQAPGQDVRTGEGKKGGGG